MPRNKPTYDIEITQYLKRPTGNKNRYGNTEYMTVGKPNVKVKRNTNFSNLKQELYEQSKANNNVYIRYSEPVYRVRKIPPRINSVTVRYANGDKRVSYYKPVRKK